MDTESSSLTKRKKPRSHYTLKKNDLIKIGGVCFYAGDYHFFDLHTPYSRNENFYVVGHATTHDNLLNEDIDLAVYPTRAEDQDGVEDCSAIVLDKKIFLFYLSNNYSKRDSKDINIHDLGSITATNIFCIFSNDGVNFDNRNNKFLILSNEELLKLGYTLGTIEALEVFNFSNKTYLSVVGLIDSTRKMSTFIFDKENFKVTYLATQDFLETKYRVTSVSIKQIYESEYHDFILTCAVSKENRDGAYFITKNLAENSRSYCIMMKFDPNTGLFTYNLDTKSRYDNSEDITSIKVNYDARNRLLAYGCVPTDCTLIDSKGMLTMPRRITYSDNGKFTFNVNPLYEINMSKDISQFMRINRTHFPLKVMFSLNPGDYVYLGKLLIYSNKDSIVIDRSKNLYAPEDNENLIDKLYDRRTKYYYKHDGKMVNIMAFLDQNIAEIIINNTIFTTLSIAKHGSVIKASEKTKVFVYTTNEKK